MRLKKEENYFLCCLVEQIENVSFCYGQSYCPFSGISYMSTVLSIFKKYRREEHCPSSPSRWLGIKIAVNLLQTERDLKHTFIA